MPGERSEFYLNKSRYHDLFNLLYDNKISLDDYIDENFKSFDEVVKHDFDLLLETNYNKENATILYEKFVDKYTSVTDNNETYLLHGDIYKNNAINGEERIKVIDPLGFKAPFIMFVSKFFCLII